MKSKTTFLMRCLALALALVLLVSNVNLGVTLNAFANGSEEVTVTVGELMADNYELTDAEKALLKSGYLAGDEDKTYTVPGAGNEDGLVVVDTKEKTITVSGKDGWVPADSAQIVVGGVTVENVTLTNGTGTYTYGENAFAVQVKYAVNIAVAEGTQTKMLNAVANLKQGVSNLDAAFNGSDANLGTIVLAMDALELLAEGFSMNLGALGTSTVQFGDAAIAAVNALKDQVSTNSGELNLQVKNKDYSEIEKTRYLVESGDKYAAEVVSTYNYLKAIQDDQLMLNPFIDPYLQANDPTTYTAWSAFKSILGKLIAALQPVAEASWTTNDLVSSNADYAALDTLVTALPEQLASPTLKSELLVEEVTVQANMSMKNVTVVVELHTVDAENKVAMSASKETTLTLAEGATAEEIVAAVAASGIEADAIAEWGDAYVAGQYDASVTELPETLTEDITYAITYSPKNYTVDYGYTTDAPTSVPYGYKLTLPTHDDVLKSYDYTVNGKAYAQGAVHTVVGNTTITRKEGKAYTNTDLYTIIADNFSIPKTVGDENVNIASDILKSGALKNNPAVSYREPGTADAEDLLVLKDDQLEADSIYASDYMGKNWVPYSYGAEGEENLFNGGTTAAWSGSQAKVKYILTLDNYDADYVEGVLDLIKFLKAEAEAQIDTLDRLAAYHETMGQLDKTKLGALNGVIDVTDFTPDDGTDTDEANLAMRAYFKGLVGGIIANNLDSNNYLKIYNILGEYTNDGLSYYYGNSAAVIDEINSLSGYLSGMLADDEKIAALEIMVTAAGYPEYAEKITDLEKVMAEVKAALKAPNSAIDLESEDLGKLTAALELEHEVVTKTAASPYVLSVPLTALDSSSVTVQVSLELNGTEVASVTPAAPYDIGYVLTQEDINGIQEKIEAELAKILIGGVGYYNLTVEGSSLDSLVGTKIEATINIVYNYTEKSYTVKIESEDDQTVTISDLVINLPKHPEGGWTYKYTVDGVEGITATTYTFAPEQLDRLFVNGTYTITRVASNEDEEKLEGTFADWLVKDKEGNVTGLYADVDGNKDGVMGFAMTLVNSGYTYIGLNGEALLYLNEENTLEIKLQTLINALLNDGQFSSQTLIDLGKNGKGEFVHASMQLGNSDDDIRYEDLDFTLYLNSVPGQMATVSNGLERIKPYMTFASDGGVMNVDVTLPEKVYEVYLAAMLATGNIDKDNMEAINSEIAFQFLWDYVELIMATDATTATYTNTLAMLGKEYDLTGSEEYYQMLKKALTNEGVVINPEDEDEAFDISVTAKGQKSIDGIINLLGIDVSAYETYMGMIYEYKYDYAEIKGDARANLRNSDTNFEAALIDLDAEGFTNKFDFTNDLPARCASIADKAAVILLADVEGDLVFNGITILDLNGCTVNGNIIANGTVYIVDSSMDTETAGTVSENVSGNAVIFGGNYPNCDVTAFLKSGYKEVGDNVQNVLYTVSQDEDGNVTFNVNTDVLDEDITYTTFAKAVAVDIAVDLVLNYYTSAALNADGSELYNVNVDDIIALLDSTTKVDDLIEKVLGSIDAPGMSDFVNVILEDLLDFGALATALKNNANVATYTLTTAPWAVTVEHKTEEDYITFGIGSNSDLAEDFTVSLKLTGSNKDRVIPLLEKLAEAVVAEAKINLSQLDYNGANNTMTVVGNATANAVVDLSNDENYATILTVILANGNPANKAELVAALNSGDMAKLKAQIDLITVEDVFTALKKLNRNDDFVAIAVAAGVKAELAEAAAELEGIYHLVLCAAGKALEEQEITGRSSKLGSLDADGDGWYELTLNATRKPNASYRGYSVYAEASAKVTLKVKLFGEIDDGEEEVNCLWGDANHDTEVDPLDASLILQYYVGKAPANFCTVRTDVNGDGEIDALDASLVLQRFIGAITKFPAEN